MTPARTSLIGLVIDALVAAARAAVTGADVFDGPGGDDESSKAVMIIGASDVDDEGADWIAATARQEWASASGNRSRDEEGDVFGLSIAWTGNSGDAKPARDAALANVADLERALRADPQLGLAEVGLNWLGISITQVRQLADDKGVGVWVTFTVRYKARLEGATA